MVLSRRRLLTTAGIALPALALNPSCAHGRTESDLSILDGWLNWVESHRDQLSLALDDGHGHRLHHHEHRPRPLASAVKHVHLAAYAKAVEDRRLHPDEQIRVGDWEHFYVPTDGGAHVNALQHLGIPVDANTGVCAADPDQLVKLDDMVAMMIMFSDSAVPDLLRNRLGTTALRAAAAAGGWPNPDVRSMCAEYLFLIMPEFAPPHHLPVSARTARGHALEHRFSNDAALRERMLDRLMHQEMPSYEEQGAWASKTMSATPTQVAKLHRAVATDSLPGAAIARTHLERPCSDHLPPGVVGIGAKGAACPASSPLACRFAGPTTASDSGPCSHTGTSRWTSSPQATPPFRCWRHCRTHSGEPDWRQRCGPEAS